MRNPALPQPSAMYLSDSSSLFRAAEEALYSQADDERRENFTIQDSYDYYFGNYRLIIEANHANFGWISDLQSMFHKYLIAFGSYVLDNGFKIRLCRRN